MKLHKLVCILVLGAVPGMAQEHGEDHRIKIQRRILIPGGSEVYVDEHGNHIAGAGVHIEILGDGSHYVRLLSHRRFIGVQLTELTPELREHFGVDRGVGVMVARALEGQPAAIAGVEVGDIITGIDGETVDSASDLTAVIRAKEAGETVELEVWRNGARRSVMVPVGERKPNRVVDIKRGTAGSGERRVFVLPEIRMRNIQLDDETLGQLPSEWKGLIHLEDIQGVLDHLGEYFSSEDWQERLHLIETMDFKKVEGKMKSIELRLRQLESELENVEEERK